MRPREPSAAHLARFSFAAVHEELELEIPLLTGAGAGFCSGLDIKVAMAGTGIGGGGGLSAGGGSLSHTSDLPTVTLQEMEKPVIFHWR